jgi:alkaline phosphatase D
MKLIFFWLIGIGTLLSFTQIKQTRSDEKSHPIIMHGYIDFREANIWVMHDKTIDDLQYWDITNPELKSKAKATIKRINNQYVYNFKLGPLKPGTIYNFKVTGPISFSDKNSDVSSFTTPALWRWRKSAPDFSIALGSCTYINQSEFDRPGKPYGDTSTEIYNIIANKRPDLMLWTGDNIYLRESDWGSETGINERYIHLRQQESLRKLYTTCPNLAIWDDHDFGPNDANSSFYNKKLTLQAFNNFWPNTNCGIDDFEGITYGFDFMDTHFLMLDNRYNRTPNLCDSCVDETILGKKQLHWLKMSLLSIPKSEFKLICIGGQFLNTAKEFENYSNWEWERNDIIQFIHKYDIKNVVFVTGDRHFSELSILKKSGEPTIYDFTVSPVSSGNFKNVKESNLNRVEGTLYSSDRNFGLIQFIGKEKDRAIRFILFDKYGNEIFQKQFTRE